MPKFEVFTKRMVPLVKKPYVTIQKRGTLSLNAAAHAALGSPGAIELMFDATDRVIGIRGVDESASHAYPLRAQGGKDVGPYLVSGRAFTAYYGIDTGTSRRYPAELDDGVLCVNLLGESTEVSSNRSAASSEDDAQEKPEAVADD